MKKDKNIFLNGLIDLAQSRLGSSVVYKTDEFFAPAKRIINPWPCLLYTSDAADE